MAQQWKLGKTATSVERLEAMQSRSDIEEALRRLGQNLRYMSDPPESGDDGGVMDYNGNTVGKWEVSE